MLRDASDRCWLIIRERNVLETPKLVGRLYTPRALMRTSFKVKGKSQGHQADIMLRPEVRHYLPNGKAYELQTWCTDGGRRLIAVMDHHQQGQRLRSRCRVVRLTGVRP